MKIFGNVFSMKKLDLNGQKWEKSKIEKIVKLKKNNPTDKIIEKNTKQMKKLNQ